MSRNSAQKQLLLISFVMTMFMVACPNSNVFGQTEGDSTVVSSAESLVKVHSPRKATIYSALIPGLGQAYNKKYWKIAVIYAGFIGAGYFLYFNNTEYNRFKTAYNAYSVDPLNVEVGLQGYTQDQLLLFVDEYHRWRDMSVVGIVLVWGLNVIEANVDAHFYTYDITPDISLNVKPVFKQSMISGSELGVRLALKF